MRQRILKRIEELKSVSNCFDKRTMRWKNFYNIVTNQHVSEFDFESMEDHELLFVFEKIIRNINRVM